MFTVNAADMGFFIFSYIDKNNISDEERKHYKNLGIEEIKKGKLAAVTMAGGQGTRLRT